MQHSIEKALQNIAAMFLLFRTVRIVDNFFQLLYLELYFFRNLVYLRLNICGVASVFRLEKERNQSIIEIAFA
jgi:hypothetical protein